MAGQRSQGLFDMVNQGVKLPPLGATRAKAAMWPVPDRERSQPGLQLPGRTGDVGGGLFPGIRAGASLKLDWSLINEVLEDGSSPAFVPGPH